jgi:hypothetical protein
LRSKGESDIEGELRSKFRETTEANKKAALILSDYSDKCKDATVSMIAAKENAFTQIQNIGHPGISNMYRESLGILDTIKSKIQYDLLAPFKKVTDSSYDESDFQKELEKNGIKSSSINALTSLFSIFRKQFDEWKYKPVKNNQFIVYSSEIKPDASTFDSYKRMYQTLNYEMRLALSDLMAYNVQVKYRGFIDNLSEIISSDTTKIIKEINKKGFDIEVAKIISLISLDNKVKIEIPEELLVFASPEVIGKENVQHSRIKEGCCSNSYETYNREEYIVRYPTIDGLYSNWSKGIADSEKGFWNIVVEWTTDAIQQQLDVVERAILGVTENIMSNLEAQKERLKTGSMTRRRLLDDMSTNFEDYDEMCKKIFNR